MISQKLLLTACLVATLALGAPFEGSDPAPTSEASTSTTSTTPAPDAASTTAAAQSSSAPATDGAQKDPTVTASMPVSPSRDAVSNTSTFTCYGRPIGYYGDVEQECKIYHFCLLGEYNGEIVYQRISYLCLNETMFDQQALDCVEANKLSSPCKESANYYDVSNNILRQAILGTQKDQKSINETALAASAESAKTTTPVPTTAAPSS